jgi:hypothetical protein
MDQPKLKTSLPAPRPKVGIKAPGPEWVRIRDVQILFGLSHTHTWQAIARGDLVSKSVVRPGCKRGVRLVMVSSIREYLARFDEKGAIA